MLKVKGHRVLVKPLELQETDEVVKKAIAAKIYIPEDSDQMKREKNAVDRGIVVQIGDTAYVDFGGTPWCEVGDHIIYSRYAGKNVVDPYTKEEFVLLNDEDVLLTVEES